MSEPASSAFEIAFGPYRLDTVRHELRTSSDVWQLTPLSSRLLEVLARSPGEVVDRSRLIEELWRGDYLVGDPALNRVVSELRTAIGDDPRRPDLVQTIPRKGYRLVVPAASPLVEPLLPAATTPYRLGHSEKYSWERIAYLATAIVGFIVVGVTVKVLLDTLTGVLWLASNG